MAVHKSKPKLARANAITRAFLCYDPPDQPVALDETDGSPDVGRSRTKFRQLSVRQLRKPRPDRELLVCFQPTFRPGRVEQHPVVMYDSRDAYQPGRRLRNLREPALFGQPGVTLSDLGRLMPTSDFAPAASGVFLRRRRPWMRYPMSLCLPGLAIRREWV